MAKKNKGKKVKAKKAKKAAGKKLQVKKTKAVKMRTDVSAEEHTSRPLLKLRQEIDRLFSDFELSFPSFPFGYSHRTFEIEPFRHFERTFEAALPSIDMTETTDAFTLTAEMPGLEINDVNVTLTDDVLTVSGEKKDERTEEEKDYHLSERWHGVFKRSVRLPASISADKIFTSLEKGVLTVTVPKIEEKKKGNKIDVKVH